MGIASIRRIDDPPQSPDHVGTGLSVVLRDYPGPDRLHPSAAKLV